MIAETIHKVLSQHFNLVVIGDLPNTNVDCVAIMEYDSSGIVDFFGGASQDTILYPLIKIVTRNKLYETGQQDIELIKELLHKYSNETVLSMTMVKSPMYLGKGPTKLHEFQITFKTIIKE